MRAQLAVLVLLALNCLANASGGLHLPLIKQQVRRRVDKRDGRTAAIGLGDFFDVTYSVLVQVGGIETPLVLDTGSADLWVVSDSCSDCVTEVQLYPQATFQPTGLTAQLLYGDSRTGTHATGPIGKDKAGVAGLTIDDQYFAAIVDTNTTVLETGVAGIFGTGFPAVSILWRQLLAAELSGQPPSKRRRFDHATRIFPTFDFHRPTFPSFEFVSGPSHPKRQQLQSSTAVIASFATYGPLFSRLISQGAFAKPMFATTLQRDTVDIGGNVGMLSIGELPAGIKENSLTWVPLRAYSAQEAGLPPPPETPNEVYPLVWEIAVDDVWFDGNKLARSTLSSSSITLSALIDTGSSLIRGPQDVVGQITSTLGGDTFDCAIPHNLTFVIAGKPFSVDPRDFVRQSPIEEPFETAEAGGSAAVTCISTLAVTDPPGTPGFLYSWSLGDPFLKSVLAAFHYGNLTHPSQDPARIGLLSTVPTDSSQKLKDVVEVASKKEGDLPGTSQTAPSGTYTATGTGVGGVPQATAVSPNATDADAESPASNIASRTHADTSTILLSLIFATLLGFMTAQM